MSGLTVGTAGGKIRRIEQAFQKAMAQEYAMMPYNLPPGGSSPWPPGGLQADFERSPHKHRFGKFVLSN